MEFENTRIYGFENALIGMRLPMCKDFSEAREKCLFSGGEIIVNKDIDLMKRLIKADSNGDGQPNSKFLRMIHVQVAITAPMYWWNEADTYKVGTVSNSTSKMHKLASTPITIDCFEMSDFDKSLKATNKEDGRFMSNEDFWAGFVDYLELLRLKFNETKDMKYWKELIRLLPESWLQTRMFDCNYAILRNIYHWRKNHKLTEWHSFCDWIKTLPYAKELLTDGE